jgi:lipopolysaccharide biosynthesis glycosyltransferase
MDRMSDFEHARGPVRVAVCFDSDYLLGAAVLLSSLERHVPGLEVCALHPGLSADEQGFLGRLFPDTPIQFVPVALASDLRRIAWLSPTTSARMLIPELLDWPRCLYIDCDVLCLADLTAIYRVDLDGLPVAAVRDDYDVADPMRVFHDYWNVPPDEIPPTGYPPLPLTRLFAPGFMVMDCQVWRTHRYADRYFDWLRAHQSGLRLPNVCGTNVVTSCRFVELDWSVNANVLCHRPGAGDLEASRLLSVHFAGPDKPWNSESTDWPELWGLWRAELSRLERAAGRRGIASHELSSYLRPGRAMEQT